MRTIATTKKCTEYEKERILSSVEKEDKVLFFNDEQELLFCENLKRDYNGEKKRNVVDLKEGY